MSSAPDEWASVQGVQRPRISLVPEAAYSTGQVAVDLAAEAGLILDDWQRWVLTNSLGERADGKWAAFEVGLVVGRQNGKNAFLEARELYELFLVSQEVGARLIIHSAHQFKTSLEHFRRLKARIMASDALMARVKRRGSKLIGFRESHGEESIELDDGSRILFAARTSSGGQGRGFTADLVVWDEAMNLPDSTVGAVLPTVSAKTGPEHKPGPQIIYTGTAVNQQTMPYGVQLARVRERGIAGKDAGLFYAEWSVDEREVERDSSILDDPLVLAQANPGLGIRISVEHVMLERRGAMPPGEFLVERAGNGDWPPTSYEAERVISRESAERAADPGGRIGANAERWFAIDVDPGQSWATLGAAGRRDDDLVHIGVVEHQRGIGWIVDKAVELCDQFPTARFVVDPRADLGDLLRTLENAGVPLTRVGAADYKTACGGFFRDITDGLLRYRPPQPELVTAMAGARTKPLLDAWKWARASDALITPLVACTLARWGAVNETLPRVWDLAEMAATSQPEPPAQPEAPPPDRPAPGGQRFIPMGDVPAGLGRRF